MSVRVGFLGAGLISNMHLAFLAASSVGNEVVAVHDTDPARAESFARRTGARVLGPDELLDEIDAVYVTTWTSAHPALVTAAAERGVAVFCEKPLATGAATVEQMIDDVARAGVVNQVGLILRALPAWILVRRLLADPRAGRVMAVSFRDDQYIPNQGRYASTWRVDATRAGRGALIEHSIHDVDILRWTCGEVDAVSAAAREFHGHPSIDDVTMARLEFRTGGIGALTSVWHDILERPSLRHIEIFCERLYVVLDGSSADDLAWQFTGEERQERTPATMLGDCAGSADVPTTDIVTFLGGPLFNPATPFLEAVRDRAPSPLPFTEALPAHRVVDAIYDSADHGGRVVTVPGGPAGL